MRHFILASTLLLSSTAQAVTIDFEEFPNDLIYDNSFQSQEFRFSAGYWEMGVFDYAYIGARMLAVQPYTTFNIDRPDGAAFSLSSFVSNSFAQPNIFGLPSEATVTGYFTQGGSITASLASMSWTNAALTYPNLNSPVVPLYTFGPQWSGLRSISIYTAGPSGSSIMFDNIVLSTEAEISEVPLPAAVWLYLSGLATFGWRKRSIVGNQYRN